jgi:hypothetical protein
MKSSLMVFRVRHREWQQRQDMPEQAKEAVEKPEL